MKPEVFSTAQLPFAIDPGDWLEPRAVLEEGVVFGAACDDHDPRITPALTIAWLDEPPDVTLAGVVEEDLARLLSEPGSLLLDYEHVTLGGTDGVRTLCLSVGVPPGAREQWRLLAGARRWTVTTMSALPDQPEWGPRLAAAAASFRVA